MFRKIQEMFRIWSGHGRKWSRKSGNGQELVRKCQEMSRNGLKLSGNCLKLTNKQKRGENSKKRSAQPSSPFLWFNSFFCVLFFSFCSNLSIWPGRQVVPYGSRCYTPIFDGLVFFFLAKHSQISCMLKLHAVVLNI